MNGKRDKFENEMLAEFFETEIRDNLSFANHLRDLFEKENRSSFEIAGNLFNLLITKENIEIENLYDEEQKVLIPRSRFTEILNLWIEKPNS
ncbi:MAG: hypothetical protein MI743_09025 [Sneathiellales bacterium]|nr:hypothetical protein [Sneathiellales bacterium]